ncbi:MAG: AarF/ABC1/UbiB kinase family protein [Myxococcales bacterium]|nr:AarF/ABC1/UbiB kinase family protein [Myxococcales bacterium]
MSDSNERFSDELRALLIGQSAALPTTSVGRFGKLAWSALRGGALFRKLSKNQGEALGDPAALAKLVTSIGAMKGLAMKSAQLMSYVDIALPDELRDALAVLQTHAQPMEFDEVVAILSDELRAEAFDLLPAIERTPVAAASIGQVHRATLPDGTKVAVKVQYREIRRAIESDFGPAKIGTFFASLLFPNARVDSFIAEARQRFLDECDYRKEARAQRRFAALFAGDPMIEVPEVFDRYCSEHVLVTRWIDGATFEQLLLSEPDQERRDAIGCALFDFYVSTLFTHGLYNCDPHPGNYLFLDDGRIAILDYGCTRAFDTIFIEKLRELTLAVHSDERGAIHDAMRAFGIVRDDKRYDYELARGLFRAFFGPTLRDEVAAIDLGSGMTFTELTRSKQKMLQLALPGEFLFLFRIRFGLFSILARLGTRANWYRLERQALDAASR